MTRTIDFLRLSPTQFEELCFDLLMELGFKRLVWRQGGADSGRDIQGTRAVDTRLVDPYEETWFFECKRYEGGVPPEVLHSKIAWADAERPEHVVLLVSSYITNSARTWLSATARDKPYRIHLIEGKRLEELVARSSSLVIRYFSSDAQQLMQQAHRAWIFHNLIPEPQLLRTLAETQNLADYQPGQLAFLWAALKVRFEEVNSDMADSWPEAYDILFGLLKRYTNSDRPLLEPEEGWSLLSQHEGTTDGDLVYRKVFAAQVAHLHDKVEYIALYCFVRDDEGEGLEVLVDQDSNLTFHIRHIAANAKAALAQAKSVLQT